MFCLNFNTITLVSNNIQDTNKSLKTKKKTKQPKPFYCYLGSTINPKDLQDWRIFLYYLVSDHGLSPVPQLLLPILYIVLFVPCWNRNLLIDAILDAILQKLFFDIFGFQEKRNIIFLDANLTQYDKFLFYLYFELF